MLAGTATKVGGNLPPPRPPDCAPEVCGWPDYGPGPYYGLNYGLWAPSADPYHACTGCTWHGYYGYGEVSLAAALTGPPPVVSSFTPSSATIGSTVTITGQELSTASSVEFGNGVTVADPA